MRIMRTESDRSRHCGCLRSATQPSGVLVLFFAGPLFFIVCEGQKFSCTSTSDSGNKGLKTVLTPTLNEDWCENMEQTSGIDPLMDMCEAFCGANNIPFLVGLPTHGFNLGDIDKICLRDGNGSAALLAYEPKVMSDCKKWSRSLGLIQMKAAEFVAALDNMTYAQLVFRKGMREQVENIVEAIGSEKTRELMMSVAKDEQLLPTYMVLVDSHLREFLSDGQLRNDLQDAMGVLASAGAVLQETLVKNLPSVRKYFEKCGVPLLATGAENEYMIDLCNQRSPNCLSSSDTDAKHVGCCCSAVPLAGSFGLSGESATRRLADDAGSVDAGSVDICGEASNLFQDDKAAREQTLQQTAYGKELLAAYKSKLQQSYPDYYAGSEAKCVGDSGRRLHDATAPGVSLRRGAEVPRPSGGEAPAAGVRQLQKLTSCQPQTSEMGKEETLRVAFWKDTETDYCSQISDTAGLAGTCQEFCGRNSVPLMLGNTAFGFNQSAMESACGQSSEPIETDSATVATCHAHSKALNAIQVKTAGFIAKLGVLDAEKLRFEASIKATVKTMRERIKAKADTVINDAEVGKKIDALWELLEKETAPLTSSSAGAGARFYLQQATEAVQTAGDDLSTSLTQALAGLEELVTKCNRLFTGVGPEQEYLLDMCSQTSTQCIESETGRHAGCCCGYLPLLTLGLDTIPVHTIPGLSAASLGDESSKARVAARRLVEGDVGSYHICAESFQQAKAPVQEAQAAIAELGQEYILKESLIAKATKYPEYFGGCMGTCEVATSGTCRVFGCSDSLGEVECTEGRCVCKEGACLSQEGKCVMGGGGVTQMTVASARPAAILSLLGVAVSAIAFSAVHGN